MHMCVYSLPHINAHARHMYPFIFIATKNVILNILTLGCILQIIAIGTFIFPTLLIVEQVIL